MEDLKFTNEELKILSIALTYGLVFSNIEFEEKKMKELKTKIDIVITKNKNLILCSTVKFE